MQIEDEKKQRDLAATQALWEDLARRARNLHCPEHVVSPWRVVVIGDARVRMSLQIYGCCDKLGQAVTEMIRTDPRVSGPS